LTRWRESLAIHLLPEWALQISILDCKMDAASPVPRGSRLPQSCMILETTNSKNEISDTRLLKMSQSARQKREYYCNDPTGEFDVSG